MSEVFVCPGEDLSHCGLIGPARLGFPHHHCDYDEDHAGVHECACGYRWDEPDYEGDE